MCVCAHTRAQTLHDRNLRLSQIPYVMLFSEMPSATPSQAIICIVNWSNVTLMSQMSWVQSVDVGIPSSYVPFEQLYGQFILLFLNHTCYLPTTLLFTRGI